MTLSHATVLLRPLGIDATKKLSVSNRRIMPVPSTISVCNQSEISTQIVDLTTSAVEGVKNLRQSQPIARDFSQLRNIG